MGTDANPPAANTMFTLQSLPLQLKKIERLNRIALAAEEGARVYPVYEEYWVGDFYKDVARGIELGWAYACGEEVAAEEVKECQATLEDLNDYYSEKEISILQQAVSAVLFLLRSLTTDEESSIQAIEGAIWVGQGVAQAAEDMANEFEHSPPPEVAVDEEKAWQQRALNLAETWEGPPHRRMFEPLSPKPPTWLSDWLTRTADSRGTIE
ncbi:hypothetical protein LZC95_20395 [Pendulispora brunnea]|uniref:Uncharacterized protein n=1 Tax=Pendulispora brunnea TaxID=2905690 RepID=A0ABZ2KQ26_9BACT